ncbi:hypothetical protein [Pseudonocardia acaciae]|uniref:hypothetical protein n=1 Tax=Pseudonocardia acaciae TaxID=551276 RepID=UPI000490B777|nr:hypothetical protein [Pseudonocardia acaciae]
MRKLASDLLVIERILRDRAGLWQQIHDQRGLPALIVQMLTSSVLALACYGAVLGASHSGLQSISSAVKLPLLFLITIAICLPTLYLFNLVFGARLSPSQALALVLVTVTVTSALCVAFTPISLFFLITAPSYSFYKLLTVAILAVSALVGLRFMVAGTKELERLSSRSPIPPALPGVPARQPARVGAENQPGDPVGTNEHAGPGEVATMNGQAQAAEERKPTNTPLLRVWGLVFALVGTQLSWTLRPFVGSPEEPFQLFRAINGNFYVDLIRTVLSW